VCKYRKWPLPPQRGQWKTRSAVRVFHNWSKEARGLGGLRSVYRGFSPGAGSPNKLRGLGRGKKERGKRVSPGQDEIRR